MKNIPLLILLNILVSIIIFYGFGFYFDSYGSTVAHLFSGLLLSEPFTDTYFICCIGQNLILEFLYVLVNGVNWYAISLILNYLATLVLLQLLFILLLGEKNRIISVSISVFLSFSLILANFVFLDQTYITGLLIVAVISYIFLVSQITLRSIVILNILAIIAGLERLDTTFLIALFSVVLFGIYYKERCINSLKILSPYLIVSLSLFGIFYIDKAINNDYYKEIEPAVYFVSMGNLTADENHLSYPDFIKFNALKNDIYNDPENISVSFILSLVNFKEGLLNSIFSFNTFYQSISKIVENNFAFFVIVFALLFFSLLFGQVSKKILSLCVLILGIYLLTVSIKMESRVLNPLLICLVVLNLNSIFKSEKFKQIYFYVIVGFCLMFQLGFTFIKANEQKEKNGFKDKFLTNISRNNDQVVVDGTSGSILSLNAFYNFSRLNLSFFTVDMGQLTLLPQYQNFLSNKCNCNSKSSKQLFENLIVNKPDLIYLSTPERVELIKEYNLAINKIDLIFDKREELGSFENIFAYKVSL